jgi:hypothetical protein
VVSLGKFVDAQLARRPPAFGKTEYSWSRHIKPPCWLSVTATACNWISAFVVAVVAVICTLNGTPGPRKSLAVRVAV